jgi:outer membrane protein assembly factor BamD
MGQHFMNKRPLLIAGMALSLAGSLCLPACGQSKPKITKVKPTPAKKDDTKESAEPDKVLFDRATASIKKGHFTEGRLDFQTLINTYPDSEYLAKAKLGVADSFYKEGGTSSLTQSIEEYKNFIVFFPFLDEAAYAQMQVGMAHYKLMEKADRDNSHAEAAEDEFRTFLMKYPQSPFVPQAEQSMRNVQEVLAEGEYGIARFYYMKKDYRASAARLVEVTGRYPLFSSSDDALWMLGDIYQRARQGSKNEDAKNQMGDLAARCYDRIIQDYPGSSLVPGAKERLKAMNMPIPAPNADAMQRMKQQQMYEKEHRQLAVLKGPMNMVKSGPDVSLAAHTGAPNLAPPDDIVSAMDVLTPGASGPSFSVRAGGASTGGDSGGKGGATTDSESVETDTDSVAPASTNPPNATPAAQILEAPANGTTAPAAETAAPPAADPAPAPVAPAANAQPAATADPPAAPAADPAPAAVATGAPATASSATAQTGTSTAQAAPAAGTQAQADKADPNTESTSKKKKGLHKIIPF